eukprot:403360683
MTEAKARKLLEYNTNILAHDSLLPTDNSFTSRNSAIRSKSQNSLFPLEQTYKDKKEICQIRFNDTYRSNFLICDGESDQRFHSNYQLVKRRFGDQILDQQEQMRQNYKNEMKQHQTSFSPLRIDQKYPLSKTPNRNELTSEIQLKISEQNLKEYSAIRSKCGMKGMSAKLAINPECEEMRLYQIREPNQFQRDFKNQKKNLQSEISQLIQSDILCQEQRIKQLESKIFAGCIQSKANQSIDQKIKQDFQTSANNSLNLYNRNETLEDFQDKYQPPHMQHTNILRMPKYWNISEIKVTKQMYKEDGQIKKLNNPFQKYDTYQDSVPESRINQISHNQNQSFSFNNYGLGESVFSTTKQIENSFVESIMTLKREDFETPFKDKSNQFQSVYFASNDKVQNKDHKISDNEQLKEWQRVLDIKRNNYLSSNLKSRTTHKKTNSFAMTNTMYGLDKNSINPYASVINEKSPLKRSNVSLFKENQSQFQTKQYTREFQTSIKKGAYEDLSIGGSTQAGKSSSYMSHTKSSRKKINLK